MIPSGYYKPQIIGGRQMNTMAGATTTQGPQLDTAPQNPVTAPNPNAIPVRFRQGRQNPAPPGGIVPPMTDTAAGKAAPGSITSPNLPGSSQYTGGGGGYQGSINGIDPVKVNVSPDILNGFDQYRDAAYQQATRTLDPQFQQARADFEQQMVGRGFSPGTEAYDAALANFDRDKNDAYSQARSQALAQGLAANQQAFGQGLAQSQLANELQKSKWGLEASQAGERASEYSSAANRDLNMAQLQWDKDKFGQTFGAGQDQQDFQNLMQLFGAGQGVNQYNNSLLGADQGRLTQIMQMFNPQAGTASSIDTQGPYNNQYNAQLNQAQANQQRQQQQQQAAMQSMAMLAMMFA